MNRLRCACHGLDYVSVEAYLLDHADEQLELELDGSRSRHPSAQTTSYVGTFEDGTQVLVQQYAPGKMTAATRPANYFSWGAPTFLDVAP